MARPVDGAAQEAGTQGLPLDVSGVTVMDGSMGRLTMLNGVPEDDRLWSARGLVEERYHRIVVDAHASYIEAGARLITTNNYAVQPNYYRRVFSDWQERIPRDTETAARLAVEARAKCRAGAGVRILGCLPPICESHRPDLTAQFIEAEGDAFCVAAYRTIAEALIRGGPVDAFIAETMNSWDEARLAIEAVKDLGLPLFVSMEGALRSVEMKPRPHLAGDVAAKVLEAKAQGSPIEALGFNCAPPEDILAALEAVEASGQGARLRAAGVRLAAYANCNDRRAVHDAGFDVQKFTTAAPIRVREDLKGSGYLRWCHKFIRAGAACCGGCCGSTPAAIRELSESLALSGGHPEAGGVAGEASAAGDRTDITAAAAKVLGALRSPDTSVSTCASRSEAQSLEAMRFPKMVGGA